MIACLYVTNNWNQTRYLCKIRGCSWRYVAEDLWSHMISYDIIWYIIYVKRRTEIMAAGRDRERSPSPRPADSKYIKKHKSSHINNAAETDNQTHTVSINAASREAHKKVSKHFTPFFSPSPSTLTWCYVCWLFLYIKSSSKLVMEMKPINFVQLISWVETSCSKAVKAFESHGFCNKDNYRIFQNKSWNS